MTDYETEHLAWLYQAYYWAFGTWWKSRSADDGDKMNAAWATYAAYRKQVRGY